ncbi:hypothetical protein MAR_016522 [Mya arenaria]|uniref:Uncharacterized protein n=1 Tax=Mya arenaria TaxID=6604 RepID=A0ABY7FK17_MYAAR|nr:hypothetical protein MAR_016522 [Mya arenaria]
MLLNGFPKTALEICRIALRLFKGKFLRFMSGWKDQGQDRKGALKPEDSNVNFAVPSRQCFEESYLDKKLRVVPVYLNIKLVHEDDTAIEDI